jgi:ornithine decarboxylase
MFLAQAWNKEIIKNLISQGITWFIVDNEFDLDILLNYIRSNENNTKINLLLRLRLKENTIRTEKHFVFGMYSNVVNKRIGEINKDKPLRDKITNLGVHFHRKTQNMAEWNLTYELKNNLSNETLNNIQIINIGGGIPSEYANTNINVFNSIKKKINELKEFLHTHNIKMIIEPGRAISAPSARLVTEVVGIHENNIIVNASVYNTDLDALVVPVKLRVKNEFTKEQSQNSKEIKNYAIKGATPCSMDLFRYRVYLKEIKVGDKIIFLNAGAYNFSSDFCDLEKLETKIVEDFENE